MNKIKKYIITIIALIVIIIGINCIEGKNKVLALLSINNTFYFNTYNEYQGELHSFFPARQTIYGDKYDIVCVEKGGQVIKEHLNYIIVDKYNVASEYNTIPADVKVRYANQELAYMYDRVIKSSKYDKNILQVAIWISKELSHNQEDFDFKSYCENYPANGELVNELQTEARSFRRFYTRLKDKKDILFNNTAVDSIQVMYNYKDNKYRIGPYKIKYYGKRAYVDISMKAIVTINKNTKQEIPVTFDKNETSKEKIKVYIKEKDKMVQATKHPSSGTEFYLEVPGIDGIRNIDLEVTMKYIKGYTGYILYAKNKSTEKLNFQELVLMSGDNINKTMGEKKINIGNVDLTMKLGGYVWIDKESGKTSVVNGLKDNDEKVLEGVIVTLYKNDEKTPAKVYDANGKKVANPRTTDINGYYEFQGLSSGDGDRYYVTFTYDGLNYQDTLYMMGQSGEIKNIKNDFGKGNWFINSKGMEDEKARNNFNKIFSKIGSYPENYTIKRANNTEYKGITFTKFNKDLETVRTDGWKNMIESMKSNDLTKEEIKKCYDKSVKKVIEMNQTDSSYIDNRDYMTPFIMDSYMELRTEYDYPCIDKYVIKKADEDKLDDSYVSLYNGQLSINQGFYERPIADLGVMKDLHEVEISVNGKKHTYEYNSREGFAKKETNQNLWYATNRKNSKEYKDKIYITELYKADYEYKHSKKLGKTEDNELKVKVTYKIYLRNLSSTVDMKVDEIVDYYDKEYSFLKAYYYDKDGTEKPLNASEKSIYSSKTQYKNNATEKGLQTIYFGGTGEYIRPDSIKTIYLEFDVKKENDYIILDDITNKDSSKKNVAEINGYSTRYSKGTKLPKGKDYVDITQNVSSDIPAGIIDSNSTPGNLQKEFIKDAYDENDTDSAPRFFLTIGAGKRKINGLVWEDTRTNTIDGAIIGDGKKGDDEEKVEGITVRLYEIGEDKEKKTVLEEKQTTKTDANGKYEFSDYVAGNYIVRFYYGNENGKYTGFDYKSTLYQAGINNGYDPTNAEQNKTGGYTYDIEKSEGFNVSDAKDVWSRRAKVENYTNNGITNKIAETMESIANNDSNTSITEDERKLVRKNTTMYAETGTINAEVEKTKTRTTYSELSNIIGNKNKYILKEIDFGLVERPKAQLALNQNVVNVKVNLADKTELFNTSKTAPNVLFLKGKEHEGEYNGNRLLRVNVRGALDSIDNGFIQMAMDKEIMQGAHLVVTYEFKIKNIGEIDYNDLGFYYKGTSPKQRENSIVKTSASKVLNYVNSNLTYMEENNEAGVWKEWTPEILKQNKFEGNGDYPAGSWVSDNIISALSTNNNTDGIKNANNFKGLCTEKLSNELVPENYKGNGAKSITKTLVLSQSITSSNKADDLRYDNIAEIIETKNTVGRRMAYSIEGNQDPKGKIQEVDADRAETISIVPPFGDKKIYYTLGFSIMTIILAGVILIKKIMKKNK